MQELCNTIANIEHSTRPYLSTWSKLYSCRPSYQFIPKNDHEVVTLFEWCHYNRQKVRIVGGLCIENNFWCPVDKQEELRTVIISTSKFNQILNVDLQSKVVHVQGGILIEDLNKQLASPPFHLALPTQGAQPYVSLVGALSTCTKGTGVDLQCLSGYVQELTIIFPDGSSEVLTKKENIDVFHNILCGMGCFGMITSVKIQCVDLEKLEERTDSVSISNLIANFTEIAHSAPRVRLWWAPLDGRACISRISPTSLPPSASKTHSWIRRRLIGYYLHQLLLYLCVWFPSLTPYTVRLLYSLTHNVPQQKIGTQPDILTAECLYSRCSSEWSIPFEHAVNVLTDLKTLFSEEKLYEMNGLIEIRFVKSDRFPLSPAYSPNEDQVFVDIGLIQHCPYGTTEPHLPFQRILTRYCAICRRYGGRFHWAKEVSSDIQNLNDVKQIWGNGTNRIDNWLKTRNNLDPYNIFWTKRLRKLLSNGVR